MKSTTIHFKIATVIYLEDGTSPILYRVGSGAESSIEATGSQSDSLRRLEQDLGRQGYQLVSTTKIGVTPQVVRLYAQVHATRP